MLFIKRLRKYAQEINKNFIFYYLQSTSLNKSKLYKQSKIVPTRPIKYHGQNYITNNKNKKDKS